MENVIALFVLLPAIGFIISLIVPAHKERLLSNIAFGITGLIVITVFTFIGWWIWQGMPDYNIKEMTLYQADDYSFYIDLYFDKITAVYLGFSSILANLIAVYSRYYLHRESGYKRFFNTKLLFVFGINLIVLAGNFETLFIGWEILGISSFLLIGFYRERYLPVRNALKVYSIYRIADIGLLIAMWLSHHLWHANITFQQLNNALLVHQHVSEQMMTGLLIGMCIVVAAAAKSAQFPFSSWLPRAMEGPTPSSAIFYGSVAVHIGVFLLLRTYPFWEDQWIVRGIVIAIGLTTAIISTVAAKVQTSVKAQIAYSSTAQIGIIFIEVALGLDWFALIHLTGNAFLRAYQLLISPSAVVYLIREQFFNYRPNPAHTSFSRLQRIQNTLFILGLKEWELDTLMQRILWKPMKTVGKFFRVFNVSMVLMLSAIVIAGSAFMIFTGEPVPDTIRYVLPEFLGFVSAILVLKALVERKSARFAWIQLTLSHFWIALAVSFNESFNATDMLFYLSGVIVAGAAGLFFLRRLEKRVSFDLNGFYGHVQRNQWLAFGFLLCCLALAGFPITTTFLGEDLLFTHVHDDQILLACLISINFVVEGLALMRMYTRIFLGPYKEAGIPVPLRDA